MPERVGEIASGALDAIGDALGETLCVVISKSGGTKETRNGMVEAERAWKRQGLDFGAHAVAVTGEGSELAVDVRGRPQTVQVVRPPFVPSHVR